MGLAVEVAVVVEVVVGWVVVVVMDIAAVV